MALPPRLDASALTKRVSAFSRTRLYQGLVPETLALVGCRAGRGPASTLGRRVLSGALAVPNRPRSVPVSGTNPIPN
jgi:hypothetical protein